MAAFSEPGREKAERMSCREFYSGHFIRSVIRAASSLKAVRAVGAVGALGPSRSRISGAGRGLKQHARTSQATATRYKNVV